MKRTLASILAALTLLGPLPSYAQSVPQLGGTGQPIVFPLGAAGAAGAPTFGQLPGAASTLLSGPMLTLPVPVTVISAPGVVARVGSPAAAAVAAQGTGAKSAVVAAKVAAPRPLSEGTPVRNIEKRAATLGVVRAVAGAFNPRAAATESSAQSSVFFDALRRAANDGAQAAADEAPQPDVDTRGMGARAKDRAEATLRSWGRRVASSAVGRLLPSEMVSRLAGPDAEPPAPAKPSNKDEWGGPKSEPRSIKGQALYGLKWAFNLIGITTILSLTLGPLLAMTPWQLYVPESLLQMSGRVELLVQYGPQAIMEQLGSSPLSFLFMKIPMAIAGEEWSYRLLGFAKDFLLLAAIRPVSSWVADKLGALPNLFNLVNIGQRVLKALGGISRWSYPIAAAISASSFALAHVAEWGVDPFVLMVQALAGLALVRTAYVSRGLVAPFTAHLAFTLLTLAAPLLVVSGLASVGTALSIFLGLAGIVSLYYNFRVHQKLSKAPAILGVAFLAAALGWSTLGAPGAADQASTRLGLVKPAAVRMQEQDPHATLKLPMEMLKALGFSGDPATAQLPDLAVPQLAEIAKPAVVTVMTSQGLGSGFIVEMEGLLVTNAHVVESVGVGATVKIRLTNGMIVPATVVAMNTEQDLALIALPQNPQGWPFVPLAPPGTLVEGQGIVTMGSPLGLPFTVSNGIVSGLGLRGIGMSYRIQITAPISHGNSGGPLFDLKGRVVGVNSAGIEQGSNLGFAIPVEEVIRAIKQFKATGEVRSSHMGIILQVGERMAEGPGVTIEHVRPGSPAEKAGLMDGDVIAGADGQRFPPAPMPALNGLFMTLGSKNPGDEIQLLVLRPQASGMAAPTVIKVVVDAK